MRPRVPLDRGVIHDFQAPGFYERHGYEVVGVIADKPVGGCEVHLAKRLAPDRTASPPTSERLRFRGR